MLVGFISSLAHLGRRNPQFFGNEIAVNHNLKFVSVVSHEVLSSKTIQYNVEALLSVNRQEIDE
jgi:hypothetical protein